jgi:hypothetical protein
MATFYLLYVLGGGGLLSHAWGGPALLRFDSPTECEAAAAAMRGKPHVMKAECIPVTPNRPYPPR